MRTEALRHRHRFLERAAPVVAAVTGWVSLNPYWFWGTSDPLLFASILSALAVTALYAQGVRPRWDSQEFAGVLLLTTFLFYVTVLPRLEGGHIKWVFVLPTLWLLALLDPAGRQRTLAVFTTIFVATLVPSLVVAALAIAGVPLTFGTMPAANTLMAAAGTRMLVLPGTLFIESNSQVLPWSGVLFRLCGIYDEPGMVGTIAALLLAAHRYRFSEWRVTILYLSGLLSFSLAFVVLTTLGLVARVAVRRRGSAALQVVPVLLVAALATGVWSIPTPAGMESSITIVEEESSRAVEGGATGETQTGQRRHKLISGAELRQTTSLDNRSLPAMEALVDQYVGGGLRVWLFGLGTDASVVRGGVSQTWKRLLTDYGALGFALLVTSLALIAWTPIQISRSVWVALFLGLFYLSIYQRPVVWMPYALLLLLCGPVVAGIGGERRITIEEQRARQIA